MKMRTNRVKRSKSLTDKDVRYALEYGNEKLMVTIRHGFASAIEYSLIPSGNPVGGGIAQKVLADPHVIPVDEGLFPGQPQTYGWQHEHH